MYCIWSGSSLLPEYAKNVVTLLIGGSTFTLFFQYIIPNILEYSSILLPFALSNGELMALYCPTSPPLQPYVVIVLFLSCPISLST